MSVIYNFSGLKIGDTVRLTEPERDDFDTVDVQFTIANKDSSHRFGMFIESSAEEGRETFYENDGWKVEIISYNRGVPETQFFAWKDETRVSGYGLASKVNYLTWVVDGELVNLETLVHLVEGHEIIQLGALN